MKREIEQNILSRTPFFSFLKSELSCCCSVGLSSYMLPCLSIIQSVCLSSLETSNLIFEPFLKRDKVWDKIYVRIPNRRVKIYIHRAPYLWKQTHNSAPRHLPWYSYIHIFCKKGKTLWWKKGKQIVRRAITR